MENKKKYVSIFAYCILYYVVVTLGNAINLAANAFTKAQFGRFFSNFIGAFDGLTFLLVTVLLLVSIKKIKGKEIKISENVVNTILAVLFLWVTAGALSDFIGYISDACAYTNSMLSNYVKGNVAIVTINFAGIIALFIATKFWTVIGDYFKGFGSGKKVQKATAAEGANLGEDSASAIVEEPEAVVVKDEKEEKKDEKTVEK